jgi:ABC-type multidrug transport system fused ATPase/permease subunit
MSPIQPTIQLLGRLWRHISPRRRRQFVSLFVLILISSFVEIISIGAVLPFLVVLTDPARVFGHVAAQPFIQFMGVTKPEQLLLPLTIGFGVAAIAAGAMRLLLLWANSRLSQATGADLSINIYRRTLYQSYAVHVSRNSSEIINGILSKTGGVTSIILALLNLLSSSVVLVAILIALLTVEPVIAAIAFGGFGTIYVIIIRMSRNTLQRNSQRIAQESTQVIKCLQEGLGGIRDVLIDGTQATYCQIYRDADLPLRRANATISFISGSPRFAMESLGMLLMAALAFSLAQQEDGIVSAIPVLGALALGAQRLLPALQQVYASWSFIQGGLASMQDTLDLLDQPLPVDVQQATVQPMPFRQRICVSRISFRYSSETPLVLENLNLTIAKGSRIGFIGATGSGKSTLIDIIMGLLQPTEGALEIDGQALTATNQRAWRAHIAHVPQAIFLSDSTISENIAFGVPIDQIDHVRVKDSARQAQISEAVESWPKQYETLVGERGVRLSGGQRQRIGIARALYKQADVIILDEATSALDYETEFSVMKAIEGLSDNLTILIIAHRLSTLKNCTQIVELASGCVTRVGTYQDMVHEKS